MVTSDLSTQLMVTVMPSYSSSGHVTVVVSQCLLLSGDVELNPGPLDQGRLLLLLLSITTLYTDVASSPGPFPVFQCYMLKNWEWTWG